MLKSKQNTIQATTVPNFSEDSIKIDAGSVVYDNKWISYEGFIFKVDDYIQSVVIGARTRFFKNRNNAVFLMIGIDLDEGVKVLEGTHVRYTTFKAVPPPTSFDIIPLVGLILIQDGTDDLNLGYLPLKPTNIVYFNGSGNIVDKDKAGSAGTDSTVYGATGIAGLTGPKGLTGWQGQTGVQGETGYTPPAPQGETGVQGLTGISWDIHIPFREFYY